MPCTVFSLAHNGSHVCVRTCMCVCAVVVTSVWWNETHRRCVFASKEERRCICIGILLV